MVRVRDVGRVGEVGEERLPLPAGGQVVGDREIGEAWRGGVGRRRRERGGGGHGAVGSGSRSRGTKAAESAPLGWTLSRQGGLGCKCVGESWASAVLVYLRSTWACNGILIGFDAFHPNTISLFISILLLAAGGAASTQRESVSSHQNL